MKVQQVSPGIINKIKSLIARVGYLKSDIGIVEDTDTATHTISSGQYVIWKNELYKASTAIPSGDPLSSTNLTAVSDGIANELNSKFTKEVYCEEVVFTPETGVSVITQNVRREGHLIVGTLWITVPSTKLTKSTTLGTFSRSLGAQRYFGMIGGSNPIFGYFMIDGNALKVDNNFNLLADGNYRITIVGYLNNLPDP